MTNNDHAARLEELRAVIRAESISYGELAELADLAPYIAPGDVELLQWAGVSEFPDDTTDADTGEAFNRAINYATELGAEHGTNAAGWFFNGNTTQETYARVLQGMDDGDPEILDMLPTPDLSGQWAGDLTGPELAEQAAWNGLGYSESRYYGPDAKERDADKLAELARDAFTEICDAYELAFSTAVEDELYRVARLQTASA